LYNYEGDEIWLGVFDTEEEANNKSSLRNLMKVVGRGCAVHPVRFEKI